MCSDNSAHHTERRVVCLYFMYPVNLVAGGDEPVAESDEARDGIILDYGRDGKLVSVEVLDASEHVREPGIMVYEAKTATTPPAR